MKAESKILDRKRKTKTIVRSTSIEKTGKGWIGRASLLLPPSIVSRRSNKHKQAIDIVFCFTLCRDSFAHLWVADGVCWCLRTDSNRHGDKPQGILSPLCLPLPPLRHETCWNDSFRIK
jgi:hypothetical protein